MFGSSSSPTESTFFASWKSAADALQQPLAGLQRRCLVRQREERDPAGRVVERRRRSGAAVADHERVRVDAGAEVEHAQGDRRPAGGDAVGEQAEQRRLQVVDPRAEDVGAAQRPAREQIAARVDGDVVRLRAREDGPRGADVERIVDRQVVDVDGVPAYPWTSFSSGEPSNHGMHERAGAEAITAAPTFTAGSSSRIR